MQNPPLTFGLVANAWLSLGTGALLTVAPSTIGDQLGVGIDGWLRTLGLALLTHAGLLNWAHRQPRARTLAIVNLAIIAPYPLAMVVLAMSGVVDPIGGKLLLVIDGILVAAVAALQWAGVRQRSRHGGNTVVTA